MGRILGHISRKPRVSAAHEATVVMSDGSEHPATVTQVSSGGFRLRSEDTMPIGEHVFVRVDGYGDFPAQIRWALGSEAGGVFLEPIELGQS